ncbi:toxin [Streptomyces avidinii]
MNSSQLRWFKSSYSSGDGDNCVEVALSWHKSTYSGSQGDDCVEVAACTDSVHVRDSKVDASPELAVTPGSWAAFVSGVTGA